MCSGYGRDFGLGFWERTAGCTDHGKKSKGKMSVKSELGEYEGEGLPAEELLRPRRVLKG